MESPEVDAAKIIGEVIKLKKIKMKCSERKGATFISALLVLMMLFFVGTGLLFYTTGSFTRVHSERRGVTALYVAEAGIDYACWWLKENQDLWKSSHVGTVVLDEKNISLGIGSFDVQATVAEVSGGCPSRFKIVASGYVPNYAQCKSAEKRTVRVPISLRPPPISDFAIASEESLNLSGSIVVDSKPKPHKGNVGSNDWVNLTGGGNLIIDGNVSGYNGINPGDATITGRQITGTLIELPDVNKEEKYYQAVQDGMENGWGDGTGIKVVTGSWNIKEDTTLGGVIVGPGAVMGEGPSKVYVRATSVTITLNGLVWIDGDFYLAGNARIQGQGAIIATGTMALLGTSSDYADRPEDHLAFVSLSNRDPAIVIGGNFSAPGKTGGGRFYAPRGGVTIQGNPHIYGAVAAWRVVVSGDPHITYDSRWSKETEFLDKIPRPDSWEKILKHLR